MRIRWLGWEKVKQEELGIWGGSVYGAYNTVCYKTSPLLSRERPHNSCQCVVMAGQGGRCVPLEPCYFV